MSLYRCAACGSKNVVTDTQAGGVGYNYVKGAVGTAVLGLGGAAAGIESTKQTVYKCPDCGITLTYPMPQEIKSLIDMGVLSVEARNKLVLRNVPISWSVLTSQYKNIESGIGDQIATDREKCKADKAKRGMELLKSRGNATQEAFDAAVDEIASFEHRMGCDIGRFDKKPAELYLTNNLPTLGEYLVYKNAVEIFVENYFRYLEITTDYDAKYRNLSLRWGYTGCVGLYLYSKYYERFNEYLVYGDTSKLADFILYEDPFYTELVKITWEKTTNNRKRLGLTVEEIIDAEEKGPLGNLSISLIKDGRWIEMIEFTDGNKLIPCIMIRNGSLQYTSFAFQDSPLYYEFDNRGEKLKEEFFSVFPLEKERYDSLKNEYKQKVAELKQQTTKTRNKINSLKNEVESCRNLNSKDNDQITALEKKIFGKKKAAEEILKLKQAIVSREAKIEDVLKNIQTLEDALQPIEDEDDFNARMDKEFGCFITWYQVNENINE